MKIGVRLAIHLRYYNSMGTFSFPCLHLDAVRILISLDTNRVAPRLQSIRVLGYTVYVR